MNANSDGDGRHVAGHEMRPERRWFRTPHFLQGLRPGGTFFAAAVSNIVPSSSDKIGAGGLIESYACVFGGVAGDSTLRCRSQDEKYFHPVAIET